MRTLTLVSLLFIVITCKAQSSFGTAKIDSVRSVRQLDPIEGIWQYPDDGATIAIIKTHSDTYDVILIDSPRLDLKPGIIIGTAVATPTLGVYDGKLESKKFGKKDKLSSQSVTYKINDRGWLTIEPYKTGYTVNFRRWMNRIFKFTVSPQSNRPKGLDGAKRIYPDILSDLYPISL